MKILTVLVEIFWIGAVCTLEAYLVGTYRYGLAVALFLGAVLMVLDRIGEKIEKGANDIVIAIEVSPR